MYDHSNTADPNPFWAPQFDEPEEPEQTMADEARTDYETFCQEEHSIQLELVDLEEKDLWDEVTLNRRQALLDQLRRVRGEIQDCRGFFTYLEK